MTVKEFLTKFLDDEQNRKTVVDAYIGSELISSTFAIDTSRYVDWARIADIARNTVNQAIDAVYDTEPNVDNNHVLFVQPLEITIETRLYDCITHYDVYSAKKDEVKNNPYKYDTYAIDLEYIEDVLGMTMSEVAIRECGELECVVSILIDMTIFGVGNSKKEMFKDSLLKISQRIESGEEQGIPYKQAMEELKSFDGYDISEDELDYIELKNEADDKLERDAKDLIDKVRSEREIRNDAIRKAMVLEDCFED